MKLIRNDTAYKVKSRDGAKPVAAVAVVATKAAVVGVGWG